MNYTDLEAAGAEPPFLKKADSGIWWMMNASHEFQFRPWNCTRFEFWITKDGREHVSLLLKARQIQAVVDGLK